ncbi:MAG: AI-2E family transporter [Anaerolineales bacterium]
MKRLIWSAAIVLATLAGLIVLWQFRLALVLFLLSLATAAAVRPATDSLVERGLPRGVSILLVYVAGLLVLGAFLYLVSAPFLKELQQATDNFVHTYEDIKSEWPQGTAFQQFVASQMPPPDDLYKAIAGERGSMLLQNIIGMAQGFMVVVGQFFIILVLSVYWSADRVHFERLWLSLLPAERRAHARRIWRELELGVGAYIRSELAQSLIAGIVLGLGYWMIGLDFPILLAAIGALLWLIPWLGAVLAVILPFVVGLSISPLIATITVIYTLGVLLVLEALVEPRLFNRRRYSSLLVVFFLVVMTEAYGLVGMILAPPLAASVQILFRHLVRFFSTPGQADQAEQIAALKQRLQDIYLQLEEREERSPEVASLAARLESLIEKSEEALQADRRQDPKLNLPAAARSKGS